MSRLGYEVGPLMVAGGGGQFLGRIEGIELLLERIVRRMVIGLNLVDQIHTRKGIAFLRPGLSAVVRKIQLLVLMIGSW